MGEEAITQETYNRIAEKWAEEHNETDYWQKEFEIFAKLLPRGKVLDIGCGSGRDYQLLQGKYDYTGVDYSTGLLTVAKQRFPKATFVEGDILDLPFKENEFDGFWAAASLLHIPKAKIQKALEELKRIAKPGGVGFIALKKGQGEEVSEDKRFFAYWQHDEFESALLKAGFEVLDFIEHPASEKTTWIVFFVKI